MWRSGKLAARPDQLTPEARAVIAELPYDLPGASLDHFQEIRSLHAPVFDASGKVALGLGLIPNRETPRTRETAAGWVNDLLAATADVIRLLGGRRPDRMTAPPMPT